MVAGPACDHRCRCGGPVAKARWPATTGSPGSGCSSWSTASSAEGAAAFRAAVPAAAFQPARGRRRYRGCDHPAAQGAVQAGPGRRRGDHRRSPGAPSRPGRPAAYRPCRRSGGSCPAAASSPATAETAAVELANVLRRPAQRTLAGRHHPLAAGRRHRGLDLEHSRRPLPALLGSDARRNTTGARCGRQLPRQPSPAGESRPGCSPTMVRSSPPNSAARAGSPWRSNSACSGSGSTTPGPTTRKPAAKWNGSTKPRRSGWPPNPPPPPSPRCNANSTGSPTTTTPSGPTGR